MLVLTRKKDEAIKVGADVVIRVLRIKGRAVGLGITAPAGVRVLREEIAGWSTDAEEQTQPTQQQAKKAPRARRSA